MANLNRNFDVVGKLDDRTVQNVHAALGELDGVNHVDVIPEERKIIIGYTPGIMNVQILKETLENEGVDISDRGDD